MQRILEAVIVPGSNQLPEYKMNQFLKESQKDFFQKLITLSGHTADEIKAQLPMSDSRYSRFYNARTVTDISTIARFLVFIAKGINDNHSVFSIDVIREHLVNEINKFIRETKATHQKYRDWHEFKGWPEIEDCAGESPETYLRKNDNTSPGQQISGQQARSESSFERVSQRIPSTESTRIDLFDAPPLGHTQLLGRRKIVKRVLEGLRSQVVVRLKGIVGSGKTAIIAHLMKELRPDGKHSEIFPRGVTFRDVKKYPNVEDALRGTAAKLVKPELIDILGINEAVNQAKFEKHLLILDNVEYADNEQLNNVLGRAGNLIFLLTSSRTIEIPTNEGGAQEIILEALDVESAKVLLQYEAKIESIDKAITDKICKQYFCVPGLIQRAGQEIYEFERESPQGFLDWLDESSTQDMLTFEDRIKCSIPKAIDTLCNELEEEEEIYQVLYFLSGEHYAAYTVKAIAEKVNKPKAQLRRKLKEEGCRGLIVQPEYGYYMICHPLYHRYLAYKYHREAPND